MPEKILREKPISLENARPEVSRRARNTWVAAITGAENPLPLVGPLKEAKLYAAEEGHHLLQKLCPAKNLEPPRVKSPQNPAVTYRREIERAENGAKFFFPSHDMEKVDGKTSYRGRGQRDV